MIEKLLHGYQINQLALAPGVTVEQGTPLEEVVELMRNQKSGCAVVRKGKKVTGIFTERDLLHRVMDEKINWKDPVEKFSTEAPVTMTADELLRKAIYLMRKKNFRHIPIYEKDGELRGILSVRNIIKLLAEHFPAEVLNLPPRLKQQTSTPEGG